LDSAQGDGQSVPQAVWIGVVAAVAVVVLRLLFVVPLVAILRQDQRNAAEARPKLEQWQDHPRFQGRLEEMSDRRRDRLTERIERMAADLDFKLNEAIGWRSAVVLGWAGMRGAITVAAAQTLPLDTPRRSELVLIAYLVAVITLLAQGMTLPAVIRTAHVRDDTADRVQQEQADITADLYDAGLLQVDQLAATLESDEEKDVLREVRDDLVEEQEQLGRRADLNARSRRDEYCRLRLEIVAAQRVTLSALEDRGTYSSQAITSSLRMLDRDEVRLTSFDES
jgi:CPA1 family monovalent cation:H+ antiporter